MPGLGAHRHPTDHEHGRRGYVRQHPLPGRDVDRLWKGGHQPAVGSHEPTTGAGEDLAVSRRHLQSEFDRPQSTIERAPIGHRLIDRTKVHGSNGLDPHLPDRQASRPRFRHRSEIGRFRVVAPGRWRGIRDVGRYDHRRHEEGRGQHDGRRRNAPSKTVRSRKRLHAQIIGPPGGSTQAQSSRSGSQDRIRVAAAGQASTTPSSPRTRSDPVGSSDSRIPRCTRSPHSISTRRPVGR